MGWATTVVIPPDGDMGDYIKSLKKINSLNYKKYFPTHGAPIDNPNKFVRALISHRRMRENQILDALRTSDISLEEMVKKFYANTDKKLWKAAEKSLLATLISLEKRGKIVNRKEKGLISKSWSLISNN